MTPVAPVWTQYSSGGVPQVFVDSTDVLKAAFTNSGMQRCARPCCSSTHSSMAPRTHVRTAARTARTRAEFRVQLRMVSGRCVLLLTQKKSRTKLYRTGPKFVQGRGRCWVQAGFRCCGSGRVRAQFGGSAAMKRTPAGRVESRSETRPPDYTQVATAQPRGGPEVLKVRNHQITARIRTSADDQNLR